MRENVLAAALHAFHVMPPVKSKFPTEASARLVSCSEPMPKNLEELMRELGAGDYRFWGTTFGRGECDLETFLQECRDSETD
jgi:hypothetical protein